MQPLAEMQSTYDQALYEGILESPRNAVVDRRQGVTGAHIESRDGERVLVQSVSAKSQPVVWPSPANEIAVLDLGVALAGYQDWPPTARRWLWGYDMQPIALGLLRALNKVG